MIQMSPRIDRLKVSKGCTLQLDDKTWVKTRYGLEADVTDVETEKAMEKAKEDLEKKVDDWLLKATMDLQAGAVTKEATEKELAKVPDIDLGELDDCPWQTYQKDTAGHTKPAKPGSTGWIKNPLEFPGWQDPPKVLFELVKALEEMTNHKLVLGDMEYSFSGKDDAKNKFLSRRPTKLPTATAARKKTHR